MTAPLNLDDARRAAALAVAGTLAGSTLAGLAVCAAADSPAAALCTGLAVGSAGLCGAIAAIRLAVTRR